MKMGKIARQKTIDSRWLQCWRLAAPVLPDGSAFSGGCFSGLYTQHQPACRSGLRTGLPSSLNHPSGSERHATNEEVIAAAKVAQCDEFISKLPDGYQTVIGENGSTLSGGECQRLSIARTLLKDVPVILLDEATASLDVDNETEIQNAISRLVKGKTVLIIAHRMRTVEAADNIVVLSDGIVAENGTHEELMKENGRYHRLIDLQTASANWKLSV